MLINQLCLEPAVRNDLDALVALDAGSFNRADRYPRGDWSELLEESIGDGEAKITVARSGTTIIGAVVTAQNDEDIKIVSLAVDQRCRRTGVATSLLRSVFSRVSREIRTVSLEVRPENSSARALYERLGFAVTGRIPRYYGDGAAALEYRAPLALVQSRLRPEAASD